MLLEPAARHLSPPPPPLPVAAARHSRLTFISHLLYRHFELVRHETNDREDNESGKYTCGTVCARHNDGVPAEKEADKAKDRNRRLERQTLFLFFFT